MTPGTRLGPYEIIAPIGAGGMGEVYKARDTRLDRSVAVKILPADFAQNAQLKMRFEREAKTISQLSHPNICTLFDVGENYLVMELLEGETLASRVAHGPMPLPDVLKYGIQIAEALGRAHRAGIVHRDLKPGNVMLTKAGAKLLDFGLAKSTGAVVDIAGPTQQKPLTQEGTILGTFQYMAPEQLEGEEADARTDIFALGVVLYEMATGKRAFEGKTKTSLIAAIVGGEPKPISALRPLTPPALEHVVNKCLAKDPEDRWQSALDIAEELRWIAGAQSASPPGPGSYWPLIGAAAALALVIGALVGAWVVEQREPTAPLTYSEITAPEGTSFVFDASTAVLSPDGQSVAVVAKGESGAPLIWVRPLTSPAARALKGTDGAMFPFWSPDSKQLGFFADGKLKRIDATAGPAETLADAPTPRGGSWGSTNVILFTPSPAGPIYSVPAGGGEPRQATDLNIRRGHGSHRFPSFLPDGRHFLFFAQGAIDEGNVLIGSLDSKELRPILTADAGAMFAPPDHLLFVRDGTLRVQRLNLKTWAVSGEAVPIAEHVQASGSLNFVNVSVSTKNVMAYVTGGSATLTTLTFFDSKGKELASIGPAVEQLDPRIAPDGHALVMSRTGISGSNDIWLYDLRRSVSTRLTFSPANEFAPVWSPDSKSIAFTSFDKRPGDIFVKRVDASGPGDVLFADRRRKIASDWSADGNYILYNVLTPGSEWDVEAYSLRDHKVIPLVHGPHSDSLGHLSPDGQWLAFMSTDSGKSEVYVQHFPSGTDRWQISGGGGTMPLWRRDGRELYYMTPDNKLMAATIHAGATFAADTPRELFATRMRVLIGVTRSQYDLASDGRLLMNVAAKEQQRQLPITLVQNWTRKLGSGL